MNIDTVNLLCFLAIADTSNITKAAERIGRTQSAVSQQLSKLETMLGKTLFKRGKALSLTQEGEVFLSYARQLYALHLETLSRFKEPSLEGEVKFGLPEDFASVYLSDVLIDFARLHPRVLVNIECDLTLNLFERFKGGEFDMVLLKMSCPKQYPYGVEVCTEKLEWVGNSSMQLVDITKPVPLVLAPLPCVYRSRALQALDRANIKWRMVFSSPSYAGTIAAVKAGLGITVLPRAMIPPHLKALHLSDMPILDNTQVCLLKHNADKPAIISFEKFVLDQLNH